MGGKEAFQEIHAFQRRQLLGHALFSDRSQIPIRMLTRGDEPADLVVRGGRVLFGTCDDLSIPRPLGPFRDLAGNVSAELERAVERAESLYGGLEDAQKEELRRMVAESPFDPGLWLGERQARQQDTLKAEFEARASALPSDGAATTTTSAPAPAPPPPPSGEAVAIIRIPKIGVDQAVVEGVSLASLRKGPGHYPSTPLPGEAGNAAIAGHRTTYGAPFNRLDELVAGDEIQVTTVRGSYTY